MTDHSVRSGAARFATHDARRLGGHAAPADEDPLSLIDGTSPAIERLKTHIRLVGHDAFVTALILGESGTGKERVASAIHGVSRRRREPFVVVNCAGLSSTLIEDELFGHVRGAFTGALSDRKGPFECANGGTVFLDEVGELPIDLQVKLLRALQQRTVQRLGSRDELTFDVQVLAATNVDLARATARGRFREDLYYRLRVYELEVPPLRKRGAADVRSLAQAILRRLAEQRRQHTPSLAPEVVERLIAYTWPGNVRELENTLERLLVAADGGPVLTLAHLPGLFNGQASGGQHGPVAGFPIPRNELPSLEEVRDALAHNGQNRARAAAQLGISRHQLYRLLHQMHMPPPATPA